MGLLDLYRTPKPERDLDDLAEPEETPEPLPKIAKEELWPPSPRVKILYIGIGFFLFNMVLLCIWGYAMITNF